MQLYFKKGNGIKYWNDGQAVYLIVEWAWENEYFTQGVEDDVVVVV